MITKFIKELLCPCTHWFENTREIYQDPYKNRYTCCECKRDVYKSSTYPPIVLIDFHDIPKFFPEKWEEMVKDYKG